MCRLLVVGLVVFAFSGLAAAQNTPPADCPTISITAPAGIVEWGQLATFTANIDGGLPTYATYFWTVSKGEIVSGQGTRSLQIRIPKTYDMRIAATIEVRGLQTGCPNRASETYQYSIDPGPIPLGEIKNSAKMIDQKLLAKIGKALREQPNAQLYVALQFEQTTSEATMLRFKHRLARQLAKTKIDSARMTFVTVDNGNQTIRFWLIPPGANNPYIDK